MKTETFEERMGVFKEIKTASDTKKIAQIDKPHVFKQTLNLLWQKARTKEQLQDILDVFPTVDTPSLINFEEIKQLIHNKMKTLEGQK